MAAQTGPEHVAQTRPEPEHDVEKVAPMEDVHDRSDGKPEIDRGMQAGVKKIEATASVWSTKMLCVIFAMIYLVSFVDMLLQSVQSELVPYVTSAFRSHGLLSTTSVVSTIVGGVSKLTIAKIIDIWGRAQGFAAMILLIVIGMIMKATCQNVETYAAAQTIFWVGHIGLLYTLDIIVADMTSLKNRMIIVGINTTPTIATTFAGPKIAELFYNDVNFRWAFGAFAIILAGFSIPMFVIFVIEERKAKKMGILVKRDSGRTVWRSCQFYFWEFDVVGMLLSMAGFALILLPFSLANSFPKGWADAGPICMIIFGVVSLALFGLWEKYFARVSYLPFQFLKDRTILGASMTYGVMFISIFCWDTYYSSYLQVVHELSISHSGYILNSYSLMSSFLSPFVGVAISQFGRFKYIAIYSGIPLIALGTGLLTHFRVPGAYVGYLAMCQILNGAAGGILAMTSHIAVYSAVSHQEIAVVYAIYGLFGSIGAAIGFAISGGIWTNILPQKLEEFLPEDSKNLSRSIYESLETQLSYPMGSPIRDAIIEAYSDVQKKMVIAGGCFIPLLAVCVFLWRDINVKKVEQERGRQTKGNVW